MFFALLVVFSAMLSLIFVCLDLIFFKVYQLSGYRICQYLKSIAKFNLSLGKKTPLKFTKRVKRLIIFDFFAKFSLFFLVFFFFHQFFMFFVVPICALIFSQILVVLSFVLALPFEWGIKKKYVILAKKKLKRSKCKVIAITGSFGKTSTKQFLQQLLSGKFSVCASPKSFNTPMGICKTILENLKETDDFLILEFGARRKGDIAKLCKLTGVDFGIITPISNCHLETFKSVERIENTKFELCQFSKGVVVFNGKSEHTKNLFFRFNGEKLLSACQNSYAFAKNIKTTANGSQFTLVLGAENKKCFCSLLGRANIDNICTAAAMAFVLGMSMTEIAERIATLKPAEHRLELLDGGAVTVIDDSYNSNFDGFCEALDVLSRFPGRKIVVSPGIVELGKLQFETNKKIGARVAEVADIFIIMNETNREALTSGANSQNKCALHFAKTREEQKALLSALELSGDTILFENDLPDNFK